MKETLTDGGRQVLGGCESSHTLQTLAPVLNRIESASLINETFQAPDRRAGFSSAVVSFAGTARA